MEVNFCIILHLLESAYLLTKWSNFASLERKLRSGIYSHVVLQFFVIEVGLESRAVGRPKNLGPRILIQGLLKYLQHVSSISVKIGGVGEVKPPCNPSSDGPAERK